MRPCSSLKHSRIAYSGLVPMSPYTTPIARSVSLAKRLPVGCESVCVLMGYVSFRVCRQTLSEFQTACLNFAPIRHVDCISLRRRKRGGNSTLIGTGGIYG